MIKQEQNTQDKIQIESLKRAISILDKQNVYLHKKITTILPKVAGLASKIAFLEHQVAVLSANLSAKLRG